MDSIENMRAYVEAINEGSFAGAARKLGLSRAVVSKYVGQLETSLQVRLLNKTTRSLIMTESGEAYYNRARDLIDDYDELQSLTMGRDYEPYGLLRISTPRDFGLSHVARILPEFSTNYPKINLDVTFCDRSVNLVDEGYDAAIRITSNPPAHSIGRKLVDFRYLLCASPQYVKKHGGLRAPEDLINHHCIINQSLEDAHLWHFRGLKKQETVSVSGRFYINSVVAARNLALSHCGIMLCPDYMVRKDIETGALLSLLEGWPDYNSSIYIIYPYSRSVSAKTRAFVNHVRKHYEGHEL